MRRRRLRQRGLNGIRYAHAAYLIARECRRLIKHVLALTGIVIWVFPVPLPFDATVVRTVLFGLICVALAETSISDRRHNLKIEEMWDRS